MFLGVREKEEAMRDRGRITCAQMLTFWCTGACILLLGGIIAYVIYINLRIQTLGYLLPIQTEHSRCVGYCTLYGW